MTEFSDSYDLIIKLRPFNERFPEAWTWRGQPMCEVGPVQKRLRRMQKEYGERLVAWRIVLNRLDMLTGEVQMTIVEESK